MLLRIILIFGIISIASTSHAQWQQMQVNHACHIVDFASIGNNLYAAGDGGIFLSTNNGDNWRQIWSYSSVNCLAVSGTALFAGTTDRGMIETIDGGKSWTVLTLPSGETEVTAIAVQDNLFLVRTTYFLYVSNDGGLNWTMPPNISGGPFSLIVSQNNLIIGVPGKLFHSTYIVKTWIEQPCDTCDFSTVCLTSPTDFFTIFNHHVFHSDSTFSSWSSLGLQQKITFLSASENVLFASDSLGGLFRSGDNGKNWTNFHTNFVLPITAVFESGKSIFVSSGIKIFRSSDDGATWTDASSGLKNDHIPIHAFSSAGSTLLAGTERELIRSIDGGTIWEPFGRISARVNDLKWNGNKIYAATTEGTMESRDSGATWVLLDSGKYGESKALLIVDTILFCGNSDSLMRFNLPSRTWDSSEFSGKRIQTLGFAEGILYAEAVGLAFFGDRGGLYRSFDTGNTWSDTIDNNRFNDYYIYTILSSGNNIFFGGSQIPNLENTPAPGYGVLYWSFDKGNIHEDDTILHSPVRCLAQYSTTLIAGTHDGVYFSDDSGSTWHKTSGANPPPPVISLMISGDYLYAGTGNHSIWRRPLSELDVLQESHENNLLTNYPNPFGTKTKITFTLAKPEFVSVKIFDVLGNEVSLVAGSYFSAGPHELIWNAEAMPAGIYYCQLRTENHSIMGKLVVGK